MFSWISSVPPAIDCAGTDSSTSAIMPSKGEVGADERPGRPGQLRVRSGRFSGDLAQTKLADGTFRSRRATQLSVGPSPRGRPLMGVVECGEPGDCLSADRIARDLFAGVLGNEVCPSGPLWIPRIGRQIGLCLGLSFFQRPSAGAEVAAANRMEATLVGEGGRRDRPAFTQLANDVLDGDHRIAQEDLVERGVADSSGAVVVPRRPAGALAGPSTRSPCAWGRPSRSVPAASRRRRDGRSCSRPFVPFTTKTSPSRIAVVVSPAGSHPLPGSLKS